MRMRIDENNGPPTPPQVRSTIPAATAEPEERHTVGVDPEPARPQGPPGACEGAFEGRRRGRHDDDPARSAPRVVTVLAEIAADSSKRAPPPRPSTSTTIPASSRWRTVRCAELDASDGSPCSRAATESGSEAPRNVATMRRHVAV